MDDLIKNANVGRATINSNLFCSKCDNRGTIRVPIQEQMDKYDELFDKYDLPGTLSHDQCRERALDKCTCNVFYCPYCEKGLKFKDKYLKYEGDF